MIKYQQQRQVFSTSFDWPGLPATVCPFLNMRDLATSSHHVFGTSRFEDCDEKASLKTVQDLQLAILTRTS